MKMHDEQVERKRALVSGLLDAVMREPLICDASPSWAADYQLATTELHSDELDVLTRVLLNSAFGVGKWRLLGGGEIAVENVPRNPRVINLVCINDDPGVGVLFGFDAALLLAEYGFDGNGELGDGTIATWISEGMQAEEFIPYGESAYQRAKHMHEQLSQRG